MDKLIIQPEAQSELNEIARMHKSLVGPASACRITNQIYDMLERVVLFPSIGPYVKDTQLRREGYRYVVAGKYVCIYRVLADTVYVYHIVHGASDYPTMMKKNPTLDS